MPPPLPFREIIVPRQYPTATSSSLPRAPPLYRWDTAEPGPCASHSEDDLTCSENDFACGWGEQPEPHPATHNDAPSPFVDQAPRRPCRDDSRGRLQEEASRVGGKSFDRMALPPRRPRRSATPPRNPKAIDIDNVPLKPLAFTLASNNNNHNNNTDSAQHHSEEEEEEEEKTVPLRQLVTTGTASGRGDDDTGGGDGRGNTVTLVFCVRNSGCASCLVHGRQLSSLAEAMPGVRMVGVVKPVTCQEREFYQNYFSFPLYRDADGRGLFAALGDRKLSMWGCCKRAKRLLKNEAQFNIPFSAPPMIDEDFFTLGGLLLFDAQGHLRFVYYEKFGEELDVEAIEWAISETRKPLVQVQNSSPAHEVCRFSSSSSPWDSPPTSPPRQDGPNSKNNNKNNGRSRGRTATHTHPTSSDIRQHKGQRLNRLASSSTTPLSDEEVSIEC